MHVLPLAELRARLAGPEPWVVAVDGRSGAGKSHLARRIAGLLGGFLVHTDDVAWYESFFGWDQLLAEHVLDPFRAGRAVRWSPQAWLDRGRAGAIEVPAGTSVLVVEGVGATRASLTGRLDRRVWVRSDRAAARARGVERDRALRPAPGEAERFWDAWAAQEDEFLAGDRPWERADLVVDGTAAVGPAEVALVHPGQP